MNTENMSPNDEIQIALMGFLNKCGGVQLARMIASGINPCKNQTIVAAAKEVICNIEGIQARSKIRSGNGSTM